MIEFGEVRLEFGTMLFVLVVFLLLVYVVSRVAMKPIMEMMEKRQKKIEGDIQAAETRQKEAQALLEEQRQVLQQAREEALLLVERAKKQAQNEADAILKESKSQADRQLSEARAEIQREKEKAMKELQQQVASLSVQLAGKILAKELREAEQKETIDKFLAQVGNVQ